MAAGPMRDRVVFQREQTVPDGGGGESLEWVAMGAAVWGSFRPERGAERLQSGRIEGSVAGVLRVRSGALTRSVTGADRAVINEDVYNLGPPSNPDRRNKFIEMTVTRGVAT